MAVLGCDTNTLLALAKCLLCFSETELLAAEALLREQFYADGAGEDVRTSAELLADSIAWAQLSDHQRRAIKVRQVCNDVVITGARAECDADLLKEEIKCYCSLSKSQLESIIAYLECLQRQT